MNEEDVIKSVLAGGYPGLQSMMEATPPLPAHSRLPPRHPSGASSSSSSSQASSSSSSQASSSQGSSSSQLAPSLTPSSPPPISPTPPLTLPSNQQPPPSTPPPPQPKEQVQRQSQFQQYPEYLREMFPKVQNMIGTISTNCPLDLRTIALETRNAEYNPKRFSGAILRIRDPKATALIFSSGKIVSAGAKSERDCFLSLKKVVLILQRLQFKEAKVENFKVHNIVGCCDVRFPIRLEALASEHSQFCSYEPELFPGLMFRMTTPRVCVIVFVSGKIVLTGAKTKPDLMEAFLNIYPVLVLFCKESHKNAVLNRGPMPHQPEFLTKIEEELM